MFRDMLRFKQALSEEDCIDILKRQPRGVLSVLGDDEYPYGMPINHFYCEDDGKLYFHGGKRGHKIDAIKRHDKVSFCVYDDGYRKEGDWALNIKSVVVFGRAEIVEDAQRALDISRALSYKFTDDESYIEEELRHAGGKVLVFSVTIDHMSGKLVNEK